MEEMLKNKDKKDKGESWSEILRFGLIVIAIVIPFRVFVAQPYVVEGSSMDPTFKDGDYLIVDQISYRFTKPERGDVIILKYPKDVSKNFIKRIIAFPGEAVYIRDGVVFVKEANKEQETRLDESYVKFEKKENFETVLHDKEYFVLGDNRANSSDSRYWGVLPEKDIVGRPILRLLPLSQITVHPGVN